VIVTLATGRMLPCETNSPPAEVLPHCPEGNSLPEVKCYDHWGNTSAGGLLGSEGNILPVVSVTISGVIPLLVDHQQRYYPTDSNTDYWEDVTL
jgi:hypothetical protein